MAVVLTLVQTKQIRTNVHKRNNPKTQYKQYKTQQTQVHILPNNQTIYAIEKGMAYILKSSLQSTE
jgi:hypothetical protein